MTESPMTEREFNKRSAELTKAWDDARAAEVQRNAQENGRILSEYRNALADLRREFDESRK
jgi:hypothetical protein